MPASVGPDLALEALGGSGAGWQIRQLPTLAIRTNARPRGRVAAQSAERLGDRIAGNRKANQLRHVLRVDPTVAATSAITANPQQRLSLAQPRHHALSFTFFSGSVRTGLPVAAKMAFSTAGATTQMVGSPTPPQKPPDGASTVSILGNSSSSMDLVGVEVLLDHAAVLDGDLLVEHGAEAIGDRTLDLGDHLVRVDDMAAVGAHHQAMHLEPAAVADRDLGGGRDIAAVAHELSDAAERPAGGGVAPSRSCRPRR